MIINKNKLRIKLLIVFLCFFTKVLSQERLIHQNDSNYKLNKVKSIKKYRFNYLDCTVLCDKEGRWIEYIGEPVTSGWQKTEYFEYNDEGKLGNYFYRIQDNGKAELKTEREYLNGQIAKLSHYN